MDSSNLQQEIKIELNSMEIIVNDIAFLLKKTKGSDQDNIHKAALGSFISQFYNGIENILKRIHKHYKIDLPKGDNWHIELLNRFSSSSPIKTPVNFSDDILSELKNFRRFRHYFFHGYSHTIDWNILIDSVKDINSFFDQIKELFKYGICKI